MLHFWNPFYWSYTVDLMNCCYALLCLVFVELVRIQSQLLLHTSSLFLLWGKGLWNYLFLLVVFNFRYEEYVYVYRALFHFVMLKWWSCSAMFGIFQLELILTLLFLLLKFFFRLSKSWIFNTVPLIGWSLHVFILGCCQSCRYFCWRRDRYFWIAIRNLSFGIHIHRIWKWKWYCKELLYILFSKHPWCP